MSFDLENGYAPRTNEDILSDFVVAVNDKYGTSYNNQTIIGTNLHKLYYPAFQLIQGVENGIAQMGNKIQDYITYINENIKYPKSSPNGIMQALLNDVGVISSIKPITGVADAGHCDIACDVDTTAENYPELKQKIIDKIGECATTGLVYSGTETGVFVAVNGQEFQIAYSLPTDKVMNVSITVMVSRNTRDFIPSENNIINLFVEKFKEAYRLGYDFEPDSYLCKEDLPFSSSIEVEWNTNGSSWSTEVYHAAYNEKIILGEVKAEIIDV